METLTPPHISSHNRPKRQQKLRVFTRLVLMPILTLLIIFIGMFAFAKPAKADVITPRTSTDCSFQNAGAIQCDFSGSVKNYKYDPVRSGNIGFPVFVGGGGDGYVAISTTAAVFCNSSASTTNPFGGSCILANLSNYANATQPFNSSPSGGSFFGGPFCSLVLPTNCTPWNGDDYDGYGGPRCGGKPCPYSDPAPSNIKDIVEVLKQNAEGEVSDVFDSDCVSNPLSFFICPVANFLHQTFLKSIKLITKLLVNPVLTGTSGTQTSIQTAVSGIINLANSFYVLIFLIIIIANFVAIPALDNYTIKKTLPKLFWAVIFTQFSLLICQMVLDIGNILGETIPQFILTSFGIGGTPAEAFSATINQGLQTAIGTNIVSQLGNFTLLIITMIVGILVALVAFVYILARYLFLVGLVLSCPLAFAAWVLPNTEQFFKTWWKYFVKLSIMFLLINLLFVLGAVFVDLLAGSERLFGEGFGSFISALIAMVIPIIILLLIPKTLKVSGSIMTAAKEAGGKALASGKESRVRKAVAKSGQEGKLAEVKGGAMEKFGGSKAGKIMGRNRAAMMEAKGAQKKDVVKTKVKDAVSKLSFDRQLELRDQGGDVGRAAKDTVGEKQGKLENQGVLNKGDLTKLEKIYKIPNPTTDPDEKEAHPFIVTNPDLVRARAAIGGETFDDKGLGTVVNPFKPIPGGAGGAGGTGGTGGSGAAGPPGSPGAPPIGSLPGPTGTPPSGGPTPGGGRGTPTPPAPPPPTTGGTPTRPTPPAPPTPTTGGTPTPPAPPLPPAPPGP